MSTYVGTPMECLSWLRSYFEGTRAIVGAARGKHEGTWDRWDDEFWNTVWELDIDATGKIAMQESRPENVERVERMRLAFDIIDVVENSQNPDINGDNDATV